MWPTSSACAGYLDSAMAVLCGHVYQSTPRGAMPIGMVAVGGHDEAWRSLKSVEVWFGHKGGWEQGVGMRQAQSFVSCASINGMVYTVCGSNLTPPLVARLPISPDRATSAGHWHVCPTIDIPRVHVACVAHRSTLMLLGGRHGTGEHLAHVEGLDTARVEEGGEAAWHPLPPMLVPRSALSACVLHDTVFAVGGQAAGTHSSMEAFDMGSARWLTVEARMAQARKYGAACEVEGRVCSLGGLDAQRQRLDSVQFFDPREGVWQAGAPLPAPRSSLGAVSLHGHVYAVGGKSDESVDDAMLVYDPRLDAWAKGTPMSVPRAGMGLAVV